jgi:DNA-binding LytR/AlgR family response regulator
MKNYNCLVLEDTLSDQLAIEIILSQFPEIEVTYVNSPKSFLQELPKKAYCLFIVDIMLQDSLTGIDLIHSITDPSAWVIISSSMDCRDYFEQYKALNFNKFFIKKPVDEFVFKTNIDSFLFTKREEKAVGIQVEDENYIMLKQGNYLYKIHYGDIFFIETSDHATTVYTENGKYTTYTSLKIFEDLLKDVDFEKANRNSLVNMNAVKRINVKENFLEIDKHQIPISRANRQVFIDKFLEKAI